MNLRLLNHNFCIVNNSDFIFFYKINFQGCNIDKFLKIFPDLSFKSSCDFTNSIKSINDVQQMLDNISGNSNSLTFIKSQIFDGLSLLETESNEKHIIFLKNQIQNLVVYPNLRRYPLDCLLIYLKMFLFSPKMYNLLRNFDLLSLPHPSLFRKFLSGIDVSSSDSFENYRYLSHKISKLPDYQRMFVLMIDEIHIRPQSEFSLNYGFHGVDSKDLNLAKTIFGFRDKEFFWEI